MDLAALLPVLQACLSHDQNHVKEAEKVLKQVRGRGGRGAARCAWRVCGQTQQSMHTTLANCRGSFVFSLPAHGKARPARAAHVAVLSQHEALPGQAVQLLRVAAEESVDSGVRHVAAIAFKNFVKRSWEPPQGHEALGAEDPARTR